MAMADSNFQVFILSPEHFGQQETHPGLYLPPDSSHTDTSATASLFQNHLLKTDEFQKTQEINTLPTWFLLVIFCNLLLVAYVKISSPKRITEAIKGFVQLWHILQIKRDHSSVMPKGSLELNINYLIGFSLLLYITYAYITRSPLHTLSFVNILYICGAFGLLYLIKIGNYFLIGKMLKIKEQANDYNINLSIFKEVLGLALIPMNLIFILHPPSENHTTALIGGIILLIYYIFRFIRGFIILSNKTKFSKFYLFLYLCTLEVIPFILIVLYIKR